jgi:RNA polymerase sigma-70 factor (ECF subfamily)
MASSRVLSVTIEMMDFQSLYEKYAPEVRRFALFLCGDRSLADDITSETFLRVWSTRGRIRELTVKSYLFAVARNVHRDLQRQGWRREGLDDKHTDPGASGVRHTDGHLLRVARARVTFSRMSEAFAVQMMGFGF